jgi:5' nucleotidase, deoxy (Pyrimidine), cytosolic type C protein (NT5C)
MGLRVAIDLDGTVADLSRAMHDIAKKKFRKFQRDDPLSPPAPPSEGTPPPNDRPTLADLDLSPSDLDRLWTHVLKIKNFWTTLDEMDDGIVARIQQLADERRWEVLFITTRPMAAGATTQTQSQEWLASKGFRHPSVYVVKGSRGRVATALDLDAVVDDRPENCLDVATESQAKAILVWSGDPEGLGPGVKRHGVVVHPTIGGALDELEQMDRVRRGGVMRSLKRILRRES